MPTCNHLYITDVITLIRKIKPVSILDIGCGFGKWGFLFREYLDIMGGRYNKEDWNVKIDTIEIFEPYITPVHRHVYDNIFIGDATEKINELGQYDLIFSSDCLEHIERVKGEQLLYDIDRHSNHQLLCVPLTEVWLGSQGAVFGNEAEAHISAWFDNDFGSYKKLGQYYSKPVGVFYK